MSVEKKTTKDSQPENPDAYYSLAEECNKKGQNLRAILYINKLLRIDPQHSLGIKMREALFYKQQSSRKIDLNKKTTAEQTIRKHSKTLETTLSPLEKSKAYKQIGDGHLTLALHDDKNVCRHNYHQAIVSYTQALVFNRKDEAIYYGRGKVYFDLLQYDDAIRDFTNGISINPEERSLYSIRCNVYVLLEEYDLALQDARAALKNNPKHIYALKVLNKFGTEEEVISTCLAMLEQESGHREAKHFFEKKMGKTYKAYQEEKGRLAESLCFFRLLPQELNKIISEYVVDKAPQTLLKLEK